MTADYTPVEFPLQPGNPHQLHVLVVDDSAVVRETLSAILSQESDMTVQVASDPLIAIQKMHRQRPDVILLDLEMPRMDGLTFLRKVMAESPIPVVICSSLTQPGSDLAMRALEEGAVDIIAKNQLGVRDFLYESAVRLTDAVRSAAKARLRQRSPARGAEPRGAPPARPSTILPGLGPLAAQVVALGASAGGTEALREVLEMMPLESPGIVIVQHMPEGFTNAFARRLDGLCAIDVKEAAPGDRVSPGRALLAPGNHHMTVRRDGPHLVVDISDGPLVSRHRPSVDVMFHSVAAVVGRQAVGVIMTGMGSDGAEGLLEMRRRGAQTLAQDEASCVVFGMPAVAIERGAVDEVVPLKRIADAILQRARGMKAA